MNSQRILSSSSKLLKAPGRDLSANDLQRVASLPGLKRCSTTSISNLMSDREVSNASWDLKTPRSTSSLTKFPSSSSFKQQCSASSLMGLAVSHTESGVMKNATWDEVTPKPDLRVNLFSFEMNGYGASQAKSANPFLSMINMVQPVTAEEAKEDIIDDADEEEQDEEIQDENIPTFQEKPSRRLNTRYLTSDDLVDLKEVDPFMYYSIPEVRRAVFAGRDVGLTASSSPVVKRRSILSYESADLNLLRETYAEMSVGSSNCGDPMDMFLSSI